MTPEQEALGRRAVACPGWMWMRGCPWERPPSGAPDDVGDRGEADWKHDPPAGALPDLSEPAAIGCLTALVEAHWGEDVHLTPFHTHVNHVAGGDLEPAIWWALASGMVKSMHIQVPRDDGVIGRYLAGPTKAHALVAALEAAGRK